MLSFRDSGQRQDHPAIVALHAMQRETFAEWVKYEARQHDVDWVRWLTIVGEAADREEITVEQGQSFCDRLESLPDWDIMLLVCAAVDRYAAQGGDAYSLLTVAHNPDTWWATHLMAAMVSSGTLDAYATETLRRLVPTITPIERATVLAILSGALAHIGFTAQTLLELAPTETQASE